MPREHRIEVPGYYHVVSRGNNRQEVFDDVLRRVFLLKLGVVARSLDWSVYAWALMSTHFHLVLEIGELGLSGGMHRLNTWFARASNVRFGRINHCFGDRFWSTPIETEQHLYASIRYTVWNPARAGVGAEPEGCDWTSFRASAGLEQPHEALALGRLLDYFGTAPAAAHQDFRDFVLDGRERCLAPWREGAGILR